MVVVILYKRIECLAYYCDFLWKENVWCLDTTVLFTTIYAFVYFSKVSIRRCTVKHHFLEGKLLNSPVILLYLAHNQ